MRPSSTPSRYIIGIDLGTTNCALSYLDTCAKDARAKILEIPQWEAEGAAVTVPMLPSFLYLPVKAEWKRGQLRLPLHQGEEPPDLAVGRLARQKATEVPGRVIHSAKSWLCHPGVDREERLLPWHSDEVVGSERRSPVEASAAYLRHLKDAWNAVMAPDGAAENLFSAQDVTITVPASFDEVAQRLTLAAAAQAGYPSANLRLIEEPQAAFYYWLRQHQASAGQTVLICDIGGGTSDFSLFRVEADKDGAPSVRRIAVSDHLLLGGDNIDLALAHALERRLIGEGRRLTSRQWAELVFSARQLKEQALAEMAAGSMDDAEFFVSVAAEGASLFAKTMTASLKRREIEAQIKEGFVPEVARDAVPLKRPAGLQQLGLPYAQDTAITRYLAAFLAGREVDAVLYTGGTLKPVFLREALTKQLASWQGRAPVVLENEAMDLAVAFGAAEYGAVLRSHRGLIQGGYPRSLYLEVARPGGEHALVAVVPKGLVPGQPVKVENLGLKLLTDRPARFQIFSSNSRDQDAPGAVVSLNDGVFHPLPPLHTKLAFAAGSDQPQLLDVGLEALLQETGIMQLYCVHRTGEKRWQLDFNIRATQANPADDVSVPLTSNKLPADKVALAEARLNEVFGKKKKLDGEGENPKYLARELEHLLGAPRETWDTAFLRSLWPHLEGGLNRRSRSPGHELSWLYLAGYALRPGYGFELDEWRVAELWRVFASGLVFPKERAVEEQWWILWRRVAGGLTKEQQERVFDRIFPTLRKGDAASAELYMLAGSLERIDMTQKLRLGSHLVQQIAAGRKQHIDQKIWALARIASRVPLYGGAQTIVRPKFIGDWYKELAPLPWRDPPYNRLALFLTQGGRLVGDREFDLPEALRRDFINRLVAMNAPPEQIRVLKEVVAVDAAARVQLFGESLPAGLVLI